MTNQDHTLALKCLVHVHLYYTEMWRELAACVANIKMPVDIYVTIVEGNEYAAQDVALVYPDAHIMFVPNRGYDIGAFIEVLNLVDLDDYAYVVKLHTKRNLNLYCRMNGMNVGGSKWRDLLLNFIRTPHAFDKACAYMESHPDVGAVSHRRLIVKNMDPLNRRWNQKIDSFIRQQGWECRNYSFIAGTMFLLRAKLLAPLQHQWSIDDFQPPEPDSFQLAHIIERILGYLIYSNGYCIRDWQSNPIEPLLRMLGAMGRFLLSYKVTRSQRLIVKVCKIPVWWAKTRP